MRNTTTCLRGRSGRRPDFTDGPLSPRLRDAGRVRRCDECGQVIEAKKGVRLDGWPEHFCSETCAESYYHAAMDAAGARD